MQSEAKERLALKSDLESALDHDEFTLLFHPIFDLDGIEIQGVESLLRWQHPTKGTITPDVFIPVLEEGGLIVDVGRWVLERVLPGSSDLAPARTSHQHLGERLHAPARV